MDSGKGLMRPRIILEATGTALLVILPFCLPLLMPGHDILLHHPLEFRNTLGGLLLDALAVFLLCWTALTLMPRIPAKPRRLLGVLLATTLLWRFLTLIAGFLQASLSGGSWAGPGAQQSVVSRVLMFWQTDSRTIFAAYLLLVGLLVCLKSSATYLLTRTARFCLAAFAFCALWILPELLYFSYGLHDTSVSVAPTRFSAAGGRGRIIWILFDELSQSLIFDHPRTSQQFTAFQSLHSHSVVFTNIRPIGYQTGRIIPSILAGQTISDEKGTLNGELLVKDSAQGTWHLFNPDSTLFADAAAQGWKPGVAGWYLPYCRVFKSLLASCSWKTPDKLPLENLGVSERSTMPENALTIPFAFFASLAIPGRARNKEIQDRIDDYQTLMGEAKDLIQNQQIQFVFIHLPTPHPPGFYDRRTHRLCDCGNYLDNLTLADDSLAALTGEIARTTAASETTLIVSSDHSWRVPTWESLPHWTSEEGSVSQGIFDPRPVFLIHFSGQQSALEIQGSMDELIEHDIVRSMLRGQVTSPSTLLAELPSFFRSNPALQAQK
jgi:hypothetical protein